MGNAVRGDGRDASRAAARHEGTAEPAGEDSPSQGGAARGIDDPDGARASLWVSTTYFAEGFPYSVVNNLAEILFKELGASLQTIGLTALFHLPWNLKFLWGPLLDRFETKRRWLVASEVALSACLAALAFLVWSTSSLVLLSIWFVVLAALSATHDMAIDGYYLEALDERGQSEFVGYRAMTYKVAGLLVGGPLLVLAGTAGWFIALLVAALVMCGLTLFHAARLPSVERRGLPAVGLATAALRSPFLWLGCAAAVGAVYAAAHPQILPWSAAGGDGAPAPSATSAGGGALGALAQLSIAEWVGIGLLVALIAMLIALPRLRARLARRQSPYAIAFVDFLAQRRVGVILAFIVLFRAGESFLVKMRWPFLRDAVGMSLDQYGFANGTIGVAASFAATFLGGWLIARQGLRRWLWPFVLAQNGLHLLYVWLAAQPRPADAGLVAVTAVIAIEQFGAGLGTAVFMVYLMRCCDPAHKAAHMALLTALMSVSFTLAGVASGFLAESMGFALYFAFTFAVTLPGMALMFFLPHLDGRESA